ncbi:MAG: glycosyltransferase family 2 protein [Bacteroidales bacterium]|nr:glycosyltransferase family 2 protein [Bacteroidales bacterium]
MDVSVIIVNYNTLDLTKACIASVMEHTEGLSYEIIVVDNASSDGSAEALSKNSRIRLVEAGSNLGFGRANNLGIDVAEGDYYFFLNSDTVLTDNVIEKLWRFALSRPEAGGVGTLLMSADGTRTHSFGYFESPFTAVKTIMDHHLSHFTRRPIKTHKVDVGVEVRDPMAVDYVTGADLFVSRKVVSRCGAFDPDFFMYCEESEMQHRWHRSGYVNYVLPVSGIIHYEGGGTKAPSVRKIMLINSSTRTFYRKTEPRWKYLLFVILFGIVNFPLFIKSFFVKNDG